MQHDVIIVGGSYASMAVALQLLRAGRSVAVVDAGVRRNRFASHSYGFLSRDGRDSRGNAGRSHGYELDPGRIGVIATGPGSMHQAMMLPDWGEVTLLTNGPTVLDEAEWGQLASRGIAIEEEEIEWLKGSADVRLAGRKAPVLRRHFHRYAQQAVDTCGGDARLRAGGDPVQAPDQDRFRQGDQRSRRVCLRRRGPRAVFGHAGRGGRGLGRGVHRSLVF